MLARVREVLKLRRRWAALRAWSIRQRPHLRALAVRTDGRVARMGFSRGMVVRRLVHLGHPRLRAWDERIQSHRLLRWLLTPARRWLNAGAIQIPSGLAHGMWLWKADLPLSHAHLGSLAFGNLENSVQEAMLRHLGRGDVFYDIGANLGFFSLLGARLVAETGRVFAFEPAPGNAAAIRRNLALNAITNVEVLEQAVSERSGTGQLQVVEDQSWSKLAEYGPHPNTQAVVDVDLVCIDDLVREQRLPPPSMVKLDVEGAEIAALRGMRDTVAAHRPAIVCELHDTHGPFLELMGTLGYRVINIEGAGPVDQAGPSAHALALPPDHPGD
jgi:FkbM family methyltransferase